MVARSMVDEYQEKGELPGLSSALQDDDIEIYTDIAASNVRDAMQKFLALANIGVDRKDRSYVAVQEISAWLTNTTRKAHYLPYYPRCGTMTLKSTRI